MVGGQHRSCRPEGADAAWMKSKNRTCKAWDLSLIPGTRLKKGENQVSQITPQAHYSMRAHMHVPAYIRIYREKEKIKFLTDGAHSGPWQREGKMALRKDGCCPQQAPMSKHE